MILKGYSGTFKWLKLNCSTVLEVSEARWVLKQVKLEMNMLKVNLNEVKARKLKDLQEKVNCNRNRINDTSHEGRKKKEEKIKLIRTENV